MSDIPKLVKRKNVLPLEDSGRLSEDVEDGVVLSDPDSDGEAEISDPGAVNVRNILPGNRKRNRRVRFNLPKLV